MKISQLEVFNFKSYCGRQVIGPFHQHFTCIIGPNGNGKSNILDAMLFVFGFKSSKLRQDNLTSLIHRSAFFQPQQAKVTVKFRDGQEQILVSRVIKKSGYCYYQLQEQKINWTELREFLIKKGIDLEKNLFIILQGEVQRLCQLDHAKLIQYLEYISGSDGFIEEIENFQSKYIQNAVEKEQISSRLSIKRKMFKQVQEKAYHVVQWLIIKMKLMQIQHLIIKKIWSQNKDQKLVLDNKISEFQEQLKKGEKALQGQKNDLKKLKAQEVSLKERIQKESKQCEAQEQNEQKTKRQINELHRNQAYIQKDLQKSQNQAIMIAKQQSNIQQMVNNQAEVVRQFQTARNKINLLKVNKLYDSYLNCWKCQDTKVKVGVQVQQRKAKLKEIFQNIKQTQIKMEEVKLKISEQEKVQMKLRIRQLGQAHYTEMKKLQNSKNLLRQLKQKYSQIQDKKKNLSNHQKVLNQIKTANRLKLILPNYVVSTLRENIIINEGYESVISAITPQLDYIVVQKYQQGKQIIQFLNARKIGRMSFILKEEIAKLMKGANFNIAQNGRPIPANTKRVFDQCKPISQEFRQIIYWAVGNTLIAQTMQVAMNVAYHSGQPHRVITMKGQFIDISGAMTKLPLKNIANRQIQDKTVIQTKIQVLTKNIQNSESKMSELNQQKVQLSQKLQKIQQVQINQRGVQQNRQEQLKDFKIQRTIVQKQIYERQTNMKGNQSNLKNQFSKLKSKQPDFSIQKYAQTLVEIQQFQKLNINMKKIRVSSDILNQLTQKLAKIQENKKNIIQKGQKQKSRVKQLEQALQKQKILISQRQQKKLELGRQLSSIQQKIFIKEIEVNDLQSSLNGEGSINSFKRESQVKLQRFSNFSSVNANHEGIKQKIRKCRQGQKGKQMQISRAISNYQRSLVELNKFFCYMENKIQPIYENFKKKEVQKKEKDKNKTKKQSVKRLKEERRQNLQGDDEQLNHKAAIKKEIYESTIISIGDDQFSFNDFLGQSQISIIFKSINSEKRVFCNISQSPEIFSLIQRRKLQFFYAYEKQKLQHLAPREQSFRNSKQENTFQQNEIDCQILEQYKRQKAEFDLQLDHYQKLENHQKEIYEKLLKLRQNRTNTFIKTFNQINVQLNYIYNFLTKGNAQINLVNSLNPFEGAEFTVRPCGKSWKNANLLSGGQKTLTSLALIFASQQIKKFPFYFMDEIDAALDYRNTSLLAKYIKQKKNVQHIVISLRKNMYQQSHTLVGIYKVKDVTHSIRINMQDLYQEKQEMN